MPTKSARQQEHERQTSTCLRLSDSRKQVAAVVHLLGLRKQLRSRAIFGQLTNRGQLYPIVRAKQERASQIAEADALIGLFAAERLH